jgi:sec-independent protein translocase protein TatC
MTNNKSFYEHLNNLRYLIICGILIYIFLFSVCFYFAPNIYQFLSKSLVETLNKYNMDSKFVYLNITDVFFTYINQSFYISLILFFIIFLPIIYVYIFDALKNKEKKIILFFVCLSPILFILGVVASYYSSFFIWDFFINFSIQNNNLSFLPNIQSYLNMVLNILLLFGLIFELPIFISILFLLNIIDSKDILKFQRYAILIAFIIGAIFTPPDPFSQIIVALLIIMLYYLSYILIYVIRILNK